MGVEYKRIVKKNIGKLPDKKRIGWVMGTGRCGTASFWNILNKQMGVVCEAEFKRCPWNPAINAFLHNVTRMYGVAIFYQHIYLSVGSAMWFLPYTDIIMDNFPDSKIVCLKRNKEETVRSWINKATTPKGAFRNWFTDVKSKYWGKSNLDGSAKHMFHAYYWCFPHFDLPFEEAVEAYYDEYYRLAEEYEEKYPDNFKIYPSPLVLNNCLLQVNALDWLGVRNPKCQKIKRNESW